MMERLIYVGLIIIAVKRSNNETKLTRLEETWQPEMEVAQEEDAQTKASTEDAEEVIITFNGGIG